MLTELKSVISVRAVEREKREQKALLKAQKNASPSTNTSVQRPVESDGLHDNENEKLHASPSGTECSNGEPSLHANICSSSDVLPYGRNDDTEKQSEHNGSQGVGNRVRCKTHEGQGQSGSLDFQNCVTCDHLAESESERFDKHGFERKHLLWEGSTGQSRTSGEAVAEVMPRHAGPSLSFTAGLAAMVAARSQTLGFSEQTFGDIDDEKESDS